jgi:predicted  nucleic acid-binding Zn-ribbon protein/uncharacterized C2H2 Zn-finger protein
VAESEDRESETGSEVKTGLKSEQADSQPRSGVDQTTEPKSEAEPRSEAPSFVCPVCNKAFTSAESLRGHMLKAHRMARGREAPPSGEEAVKPRYEERALPPTLREDPYVRSLIEEKERLRRENELLSEELTRLRLLQRRMAYMDFIDAPNQRRPKYEDDEDDLVALKKARLYEEEAKRIQMERLALERSLNSKPEANPEVETLKSTIEDLKARLSKMDEENRELRRKLEESERKRIEDTITSLKEEIKELKSNQYRLASQYDVAIEMIRSVKEVLIRGMTPVHSRPKLEESEETRRWTEERVEELLPEELIEET